MITPCHKKFYQYPYNEFIRCKDWNSVYDFIYDRKNIWGRSGFFTHLSTLLAYIKKHIKIVWFDSRRKRNKYMESKKCFG